MIFNRIQPEKLDALLASAGKAIVIDVRDSDYPEGGYYKKSINIPVGTILESSPDTAAMLHPYDTIVCYCMLSQQRGPAAAQHLCSIFPNKKVYVVTGGFSAMYEYYGPRGQIVGYRE